jgi:hypothetical protein
MSSFPYHLARRIDARRALVFLAACVAGFAVLGLVQAKISPWNFQAFDLADSDLGARVSMQATFTSLLLAASSLLAFSLADVDKHTRQRKWLRAGWVFAALAVEELLGFHGWLDDLGVPAAVSYLPLLVVATALLYDAFGMLERQPRTQALFGAALAGWLIGGLADSTTNFKVVEIVEMAAAAMFVVSLLARCQYLARAYHPIDEAETRPSFGMLADALVQRLPLRRIAVGLALVTGAFAIQYVLLHTGNYHHAEKAPILDLNNEQTLWATFQGSLIWIVAGLAVMIGCLDSTRPARRRWWLILGLSLFVLGADEVIAIHDRFQDATGHPGQIILAPLAIVAVIGWWKALQELSDDRLARALWIAGAAIWAYSQTSDILLNPIDSFRWTITPEEVAETTGSALWMFSLVIWLRVRFDRQAAIDAEMTDDTPSEFAPVTREETPA